MDNPDALDLSNTEDDPNGGEVAVLDREVPVENEVEISTEILIMLFVLMLSITCGRLLRKSKHKYL